MEQYFYGDDGKNASETEGKAVEPAQPVKKEVLQPEEDLRESSSDPSKNLEGSLVWVDMNRLIMKLKEVVIVLNIAAKSMRHSKEGH